MINNINIPACNNNIPCNSNNVAIPGKNVIDNCCIGQSGCYWNGELDSLLLEPIYVQKIYDSALFHLQGLSYAQALAFSPALPAGSTIVKINFINITKYFDPSNLSSSQNFSLTPETTLQGAEFVCDNGTEVLVTGPDGNTSQKLVYTDTSCCDNRGKGTPIFGSQSITVNGTVRVDMEVEYIDPDAGGCPISQVLTAYYAITAPGSTNSLVLTNFFELCIPSVYEGAFLPRFTELCNATLSGRLMTNNITRDIAVSSTGIVTANILISICISCEKKIVVPVQLCVLSTGFTQLTPETGAVCSVYPSLFPNQIDENTINSDGGNERRRQGCCNQGL